MTNPKGETELLPSVWTMHTDDGFYPVNVLLGRDKPEDHGRLNPHVMYICDLGGNVLWYRPQTGRER